MDIKPPREKSVKVKTEEFGEDDRSFSAPLEHDRRSDEEAGDAGTDTTTQSRSYRSDAQELKRYPPLILSPVISYISIVILRLPVTLSDIYSCVAVLFGVNSRWIKSEEFPYAKAHNLIPAQMLKRLHSSTRSRFIVNVTDIKHTGLISDKIGANIVTLLDTFPCDFL